MTGENTKVLCIGMASLSYQAGNKIIESRFKILKEKIIFTVRIQEIKGTEELQVGSHPYSQLGTVSKIRRNKSKAPAGPGSVAMIPATYRLRWDHKVKASLGNL